MPNQHITYIYTYWRNLHLGPIVFKSGVNITQADGNNIISLSPFSIQFSKEFNHKGLVFWVVIVTCLVYASQLSPWNLEHWTSETNTYLLSTRRWTTRYLYKVALVCLLEKINYFVCLCPIVSISGSQFSVLADIPSVPIIFWGSR